MKVIALILGVLALAYEGECFAWQTPALTGGGDAGQVATINQGDTGTLYTVGVTTSTAFAIVSQVPAGVLKITFATETGVIDIVSGQTIDYQAATTHVLVITGTFSTVETATLTLVVSPLYFPTPNRCVTISGYYAAASNLATQTAAGATTITYASVSATTGYTFTIADGTIKNTAAVTTTTTAAVTVVATASEGTGTAASSATTTVAICINGGCDCSTYGFSGSSALAAGLLSVIMVLVMQLK